MMESSKALARHATTHTAIADVNVPIAEALREMALLLEAQADNPFRVAAYRRAADTIARLPRSLSEIHSGAGVAGLDELPGVGPRIAAAIAEMLSTGRWQQLERLRGSADPEALFRTIPGVGPDLAQRLHEGLGADTLEALESAARAGRLEAVQGIGTRRALAIRAALTDMLDRKRLLQRAAPITLEGPEPPVDMLLTVDREYRMAAQAEKLPKIAPRRFNPDGLAWLPVLHTEKSGWHFTALYSNTARAHELERTRDWVVIYAEDEAHHERPIPWSPRAVVFWPASGSSAAARPNVASGTQRLLLRRDGRVALTISAGHATSGRAAEDSGESMRGIPCQHVAMKKTIALEGEGIVRPWRGTKPEPCTASAERRLRG
jgi:hypothetical protein